MCRQGGKNLCAERQGNYNQVAFATIWRGSGRCSDTTLLSFFVMSQGRCLRAYPFRGQPLLQLDLGGVGDVGRDFCGGRDGLLLRWDTGWLCPCLASGYMDARGSGTGTGATAGLLAGFIALFNGPSFQRGYVARCPDISEGV